MRPLCVAHLVHLVEAAVGETISLLDVVHHRVDLCRGLRRAVLVVFMPFEKLLHVGDDLLQVRRHTTRMCGSCCINENTGVDLKLHEDVYHRVHFGLQVIQSGLGLWRPTLRILSQDAGRLQR